MKTLYLSLTDLSTNDSYYVDDRHDIAIILSHIPKTIRFKKNAKILDLRRKFFAMETELRKNAKNGDSELDFHTNLKPLLFKKMEDFGHYFTTNIPEYSTKHLTAEGFSALIEQLRVVACDIYGYIFKK